MLEKIKSLLNPEPEPENKSPDGLVLKSFEGKGCHSIADQVNRYIRKLKRDGLEIDILGVSMSKSNRTTEAIITMKIGRVINE